MTQRERDEFMMGLAVAWPHASIATRLNFARRIVRAAGQHLRACEGDCSLRPPDGHPDYWTQLADKAERAAVKAATDFGAPFMVIVQGDPRGATMRLGYHVTGEEFERLLYPPCKGFPARVFERT